MTRQGRPCLNLGWSRNAVRLPVWGRLTEQVALLVTGILAQAFRPVKSTKTDPGESQMIGREEPSRAAFSSFFRAVRTVPNQAAKTAGEKRSRRRAARAGVHMKLVQMTSPEVDALSRETVVVLPCGSVEQHSLHLPVQTDALLTETIATRAAERHPADCLLLPTLWLGSSHHHLSFAGTLSASPRTHVAVLKEVLESLIRHRFERFLVVNGHGGNLDSISIALRELNYAHPNALLVSAPYWMLVKEPYAEVRTGPKPDPGHACEFETSLMLAVRPDLVREGEVDDDNLSLNVDLPGVTVVSAFDQRTAHGGSGCPSHASAEKGRLLLEAAVNAVANVIARMHKGLYWRGS
jgi:creatinine amidohydrolase